MNQRLMKTIQQEFLRRDNQNRLTNYTLNSNYKFEVMGCCSSSTKQLKEDPKTISKRQHEAKQLERQRQIEDLRIKIGKLTDDERRLEEKQKLYKEKMKRAIQAGDTKQQTRSLQEASRTRKRIQDTSARKKMLLNKKASLQTMMGNSSAIEAAYVDQEMIKDNKRNIEKLDQSKQNAQEVKLQQNIIRGNIKELGDLQQIEEEKDEIMEEVRRQMTQAKKTKEKYTQNATSNEKKDDIAAMLESL